MTKDVTIRDYFDALIRIIKERSYFIEDLDVEKEWEQRFSSIQDGDVEKAKKVHQAAQGLLRSICPHNSFINQSYEMAQSQNFLLPTGAMMPDANLHIGYVQLPQFGSNDGDQMARYVKSGALIVKDIMDQNPRGVILDLRDNQGGNCWAMMPCVLALLDRGMSVGWHGREGLEWSLDWSANILHERQVYCEAKPNEKTPVAVLQNGDTNSAGEFVTLAFKGGPLSKSFGVATSGFSTVNSPLIKQPFPEIFNDKSFVITTHLMGDRHHNIYGIPIEPDVYSQDPIKDAIAWICSYSPLIR